MLSQNCQFLILHVCPPLRYLAIINISNFIPLIFLFTSSSHLPLWLEHAEHCRLTVYFRFAENLLASSNLTVSDHTLWDDKEALPPDCIKPSSGINIFCSIRTVDHVTSNFTIFDLQRPWHRKMLPRSRKVALCGMNDHLGIDYRNQTQFSLEKRNDSSIQFV